MQAEQRWCNVGPARAEEGQAGVWQKYDQLQFLEAKKATAWKSKAGVAGESPKARKTSCQQRVGSHCLQDRLLCLYSERCRCQVLPSRAAVDSHGGYTMLWDVTLFLNTEHKVFPALAVLLPRPFKYSSYLCLLIAQEPKPPTTFKGIWINTLSSGSCVMARSCWPAEPRAAQRAACLWTDVAPVLHICVTPSPYWPSNSPQSWGTNVWVCTERTVQNSNSEHRHR